MNISALAADKATPIAYERFLFTLEVSSLMVLPPYKGAVFRGAFGGTFKRIVCAAPRADCPSCMLRRRCLYVGLFEPPPPERYADAGKFRQAPPPYVLNPPLTNRQVFHPRELLECEMVLIGPGIRALPYFVYAFVEMGRRGLGPERGRYELVRVDLVRGGETAPIYDGGTQTLVNYPSCDGMDFHPEDGGARAVTLEFLSPLRLKVKGDLVTQLTFPVFFERLAQRLTLLAAFYNSETEPAGLDHLAARARDIRVTSDELYWYDWGRYSTRQKEAMKLGGLRGRIGFAGELGPFMPYLRLGACVNVGLNTTFGLGRYKTLEGTAARNAAV